jgi:malate dehydrogenase
VENIIEFALDAEEQEMMNKSVAAVKGLVDSMK